MNLPLSLTVQSLNSALKAQPGLRSNFHLMVTIAMGALEQAVNVPTDYALVIDRSGSTITVLGETGSILDTARVAAENVINSLGPDDRIAIFQFDAHADLVFPFTSCNPQGKLKAINAVYSIGYGGSTAFAPALQLAFSHFGQEAMRKKAIVFFTDGQNVEGGDPVPIAQQIRESGISLFIGGLGVNNEGEKLLDEMGGANFKSLSSADEVLQFFAGAQAQASLAVVTNAKLLVAPVVFAQITSCELVTRQGQPNYVPADASGKVVSIGDVGTGDELKSYLGLQVVLPEDIKAGRRSFGKLELIGDVPSQGTKGQVLASSPIVVSFADQPILDLNPAVKDMINIAATSREIFHAGQAKSADEMKQHLDNARKTVAFSQDAVAKALAAQLRNIEQQVAQDPEAAQKQARRATKGFSAAEAAEALKKMKGAK